MRHVVDSKRCQNGQPEMIRAIKRQKRQRQTNKCNKCSQQSWAVFGVSRTWARPAPLTAGQARTFNKHFCTIFQPPVWLPRLPLSLRLMAIVSWSSAVGLINLSARLRGN